MLKSASSHSQYGSSQKGSLNLFGGGTRCLTIDICPDLLIAAAALAGAAAFYILYQAISAKGRKRRRRRTFEAAEAGGQTELPSVESFPFLWDLMFAGRIIIIISLVLNLRLSFLKISLSLLILSFLHVCRSRLVVEIICRCFLPKTLSFFRQKKGKCKKVVTLKEFLQNSSDRGSNQSKNIINS